MIGNMTDCVLGMISKITPRNTKNALAQIIKTLTNNLGVQKVLKLALYAYTHT